VNVTIGEEIALRKGQTDVIGICCGLRVDALGEIAEIWVEGFYSGFDIGPTDMDWKIAVTGTEAD